MSTRLNLRMQKLSMFVIVIVISLCGCSMPNHDNLYNDSTSIINEDNLCSLEEATTKKEGTLYEKTLNGSSGIETIWNYKIMTNEDIDMQFSLSAESGSAKLVLITGSDEIFNIAEISNGEYIGEVDVASLSLDKGNNRIKLITKDKARVSLKLTIAEGNYN